VAAVVLMFSVTEVEPFAGGLAEFEVSGQVVPPDVGHPDTLRFTAALNPLNELMVTWELPELPWATVNEDGVAERLKSCAAGTMWNEPIKLFQDPVDVVE
jgi:hypothetical protein